MGTRQRFFTTAMSFFFPSILRLALAGCGIPLVLAGLSVSPIHGDERVPQLVPRQAEAVRGGEEPEMMPVFVPAPSDVRRPWMRASRAIDEGRYSDAAFELGRLLANEATDQAEGQDFFLPGTDADRSGATTSLRGEVARMLAQLPAAGRQAYELQFGTQARALLDEAVSAGDAGLLEEVIRRFFHTRAGQEATLLAGRTALSRGQAMVAARHLQRLADSPQSAARFEPELSLLLATSWLYADMPERAQQALTEFQERTDLDAVTFAGNTIPMFEQAADFLEWLDSRIQADSHPLGRDLTEWLVYRGNPQRNAQAPGSLPLLNPRWRVPTCTERQDEQMVEKLVRQYRDESRATLPAVQPLAVGETILMRTPQKLMGVDFSSGKRIWVWPPWETETAEVSLTGPQGARLAQTSREQQLHQRLWDDAAHGQVSSDGRSVFLIHDLGYAAEGQLAAANRVFIGRVGARGGDAADPRSTNQLVSLSLARQGAAQWIVGGEDGEDEPQLAGAFFLGAPLPLDGHLYALAEFHGEIRLVVLNAANGRLEWQQQLAHVESQQIEVDSRRRLAGATPSYEGGVLLCPTSAGALVAVDLASRSLLWGYSYVPVPDRSQQRGFGIARLQARASMPQGARWADATVTVAGGRVLLTPVETDELHGLDLLTGERLWEPQPRDGRLFLACIHHDLAVFVSNDQVTALRLADGQPAWESPVELTDPPSGRGFYNGQAYFLPTTGSELLKIALDQEQAGIARRLPTRTIMGNLIAYRDEIVSHGPDWLSIYHQSEPLRARVEQQLAENPDDVQALAHYGELLVAQGQTLEAIETLRQVCQLDPENQTARQLLVETLLSALEEDFVSRLDTVDEIQRLTEHPGKRSRLLRLLAGGWQQQGEIERAFGAYIELADLQESLFEQGGSFDWQADEVERGWSCRPERWLEGRLRELLAAAEPEPRQRLEQELALWRDAAEQDNAARRRFLRYFSQHPAADSLHLNQAAEMVAGGEAIAAQLLLTRLETHPEDAIRRKALALMAQLLVRTAQEDQALAYYSQLAEHWSDQVCWDGKTGQQLVTAASRLPGFEQAQRRAEPWPPGEVEVSQSSETGNRYPSYRRVFSCQLRQQSGPAPRGLRVFYDQHPNSLIVRDGQGATLLNLNLGTRRLNTADFGLTHFRLHGHLLVVSLGVELLAIDLIQAARNPNDPILWRKELISPVPGATPFQMQVRVHALRHPWGDTRRVFADQDEQLQGVTGPLTARELIYMNSRELIAADPLTGETIWSREQVPPGSDVFGDEEYVFVVPPQSAEARVFQTLDGKKLGRRQVDSLPQRWSTWGRHVLAWSEQQDAMILRVYDAWTGESIWREDLPKNAKATLIEDDEVAILQADGRFLIRSLQDDQTRLEADLEPEPGLLSLHVIRSRKQYLLVTNRTAPVEPNTPAAQIRTVISGLATPLITGHAYAFDRESGQPMWPEPQPVERFGFPIDQPAETPVLLFLRQQQPGTGGGARQQHTSVWVLDRNTGQVVLDDIQIPTQTYTYDMVADRVERTVTLGMPTRTLTLQWPEDPAFDETATDQTP